MIRRRLPDFALITLLMALPLILFWQQTVGGRTLIPSENLYQFEPYATYQEVVKAPAIPHNALVSDLVLQNFQWKSFIRESLAQGEIPLWNPHQFSGIPFLAAGQQSTLYPFSILYYLLPLPAAYGWFTVVQLWLAGVFMFLFLRGLRSGRFGALLAGVIYQLSGFFVISAVFPMIIASAAWLPLVLLAVEFIIQQRPALREQPSTVPWVALGAVALGGNILAGHIEITYYVLIIAAYYAAARLLFTSPPIAPTLRQAQSALTLSVDREGEKTKHALNLRIRLQWMFNRGLWLVVMVALGLGLGAVQIIPLFEFASLNYRDGRATLEQVLGWAHPPRDLIQFLLPNFYGNPSHHSYFDVFTGQTVTQFTNAQGQPIPTIDWGIKNYVEGALYLGILPLTLAVYGLINSRINHRDAERAEKKPPYRAIFAILTIIALTFMFGLPTYALLYYGFPGINQLHSPFRWVFAVTLGVAVLAGFGADRLARKATKEADGREKSRPYQMPTVGATFLPSAKNLPSISDTSSLTDKLVRVFAYSGLISGVSLLLLLLVSRLFFTSFEPVFQRLVDNMALAGNAFADAKMFYSYQFVNIGMLGLMLLSVGVVFWLARRNLTPSHPLRVQRGGIPIWQPVAIALVAIDLMAASWSFNPASDPALLDFTPPAIQWLKQQPGEWRFTTIDDPALGERGKVMNANMGWRYGLDDIRGYESIIPKQYVDFMAQLAPQVQLDFNRVAPLYPDEQYQAMGKDGRLKSILSSPLLSLLNVRYIITSRSMNLNDYLPPNRDVRSGSILPPTPPVYEDEAVRIWEQGAMPRAYVAVVSVGDEPTADFLHWGPGFDVAIEGDTGREKILHANITPQLKTSWLVVSETHLPGWRAFVRPRGGDDQSERPLDVQKVMDNFIGMNVSPAITQELFADVHNDLPEAQQVALDNGQITVRLVYSPPSFQIGLFGSFISTVLLVFLGGIHLWRLFVGGSGQSSGVQVVARNSLAPIILNLFNRGIDFGFAFVMLRVLGPEGNGIYTYAAFIFIWFDIFTNFGLNVFLTREVARDHSKAWRYLFNTSLLRLLLIVIGIGALIGFLFLRQSASSTQSLTSEAVIAIILLYIGLLPNSLSAGMSALFYAYQKAEYPAAISTISTICKTLFGLMVLVSGLGVIGLAGVSILTNTITLVIMVWVGRGLLSPPQNAAQRDYQPDRKLIRGMVGEGWPLMLNHFLATIFFQIDVIIIQYFHGDVMLGQYGVAYKWISALNVIPAFFTMALLPLMSKQAHEDRAALKRNYTLAIKLLVSTALPVAVLFTFLAYTLTGVLGGREFLPDGAIATQLMIWSIPIGWMNSLTQYVLIALDLQGRITRAFILAVGFNIISNLLLIPPYGYRAAALTTIASELILLVPFALLLRGALGHINWLGLLWKPAAGTAGMIVALLAGWSIQPLLALMGAIIVYAGILLALRPLDAGEVERLKPLIPFKRLRVKSAAQNT